jgi:hypothetical protein
MNITGHTIGIICSPTFAGQVGEDLGHLARIDAGVLREPDPAKDVLCVEVGVELLHLAGTHEVALHAGGAVAARPPLQRYHPVPRRGNVHAPAVLHAKVKTFVLEDIELSKSTVFLCRHRWGGCIVYTQL